MSKLLSLVLIYVINNPKSPLLAIFFATPPQKKTQTKFYTFDKTWHLWYYLVLQKLLLRSCSVFCLLLKLCYWKSFWQYSSFSQNSSFSRDRLENPLYCFQIKLCYHYYHINCFNLSDRYICTIISMFSLMQKQFDHGRLNIKIHLWPLIY